MENSVTLVSEYEINRFTMAVLPIEDQGKVFSKIMEVEGDIYVDLPPLKIIDDSCNYYGASMEGRKSGTKMVTGVTHKSPLAIDPMSDLYFFPTMSPKKNECTWISLNHVEKTRKTSLSTTIAHFTNKTEMEFQISLRSFETQMHRAALLRTRMLQRAQGSGVPQEHRDYVASPPRTYRIIKKK